MSKGKNIDDQFRDKLQDFEQSSPPFVLENVLAGVAGIRRKRKIVLWRMVGVAAALLLVFITGWEVTDMKLMDDFNQPAMLSQQSNPESDSETITKPDQSGLNNQGATSEAYTSAFTSEVSSENLTRISSDSKVGNSFLAEDSETGDLSLIAESSLISSVDQNTKLKTVESISGTLQQDLNPEESLQEKVTEEKPVEWPEKTIDQQIMEQNKRIVLAENKDKAKGKWLLGAQISPGYSVSRSSHSDQYASNMIKSQSSGPVDLGGGISVEYKSGKRWSIQSGVYYSGLAQSSGNSTKSNGRDYAFASADHGEEFLNPVVNVDAGSNNVQINSAAGVIELESIPSELVLGTNIEDKTMTSTVIVSSAEFTQNFDYIEVPLYLRYTLIDARFDVEMLGGFSSNVLVGNQTYMENGSGKTLVGQTNEMKTINYSGTLGIGLKYGLSKHIFLNVEPRVKYYLNSLNSNASVTYKPYTIGVYTGVSYQF